MDGQAGRGSHWRLLRRAGSSSGRQWQQYNTVILLGASRVSYGTAHLHVPPSTWDDRLMPPGSHHYFMCPFVLLLFAFLNLSKGPANTWDVNTDPKLQYSLHCILGPRIRLPQRGNRYK